MEQAQREAWNFQIANLQENLKGLEGRIYFEFAIPRMGKRVDVVLLIQSIVFVLEYKVGETDYPSHAVDQVIDYALDLKNFHATSHDRFIVPVLVASNATDSEELIHTEWWKDWVLRPLKTNGVRLGWLIREILAKLLFLYSRHPMEVEPGNWEQGSYLPTPTIIEAAMALYGGHSVADISRREAAGEELHRTTDAIGRLIARAKAESFKAVCFVTGVPGKP
ncbi:MAG: hypothetical protein LW700_09360 [Gemmataceae bacterium]|nr:hypothetical protein [Gemmataceae bacterium]